MGFSNRRQVLHLLQQFDLCAVAFGARTRGSMGLVVRKGVDFNDASDVNFRCKMMHFVRGNWQNVGYFFLENLGFSSRFAEHAKIYLKGCFQISEFLANLSRHAPVGPPRRICRWTIQQYMPIYNAF